MIIESQDGTLTLDSSKIKYFRKEERHIVGIDYHGLVFSIGEYNDVESAWQTLRYVMSDPEKDFYKMYKEEL